MAACINAVNAVRCTARQGVGSYAEAGALVAECSLPVT
jgi:hypothetical protein